MIPSLDCYETIKRFERLRLNAYLDPVGVWTIAYGCTYYEDGTRVKEGDKVNRNRAEVLLNHMVGQVANAVNRLVTSKINQNQFDALVSFVYNIGIRAFQKSTLLRKVNTNSHEQSIYNEFLRWNKGTVKGKKVVLPGLIRRRKLEAELYFKLPA